MIGEPERALLSRRWLHSHEEDSGDSMVFRPAEFGFPPSRGRSGFELGADGQLIDVAIAPTDGPQEFRGSWKLEEGRLELFGPGALAPERVFEVESVEEDRLVVRRLPPGGVG